MRHIVIPVALGAAILAIALDGGGFAPESRGALAIALWWSVLVTVALGVLPVERVTRPAIVAGAFLAALGVVTAASMGWAASSEKAFAEFNRVSLYLGVFAVAALAGSRITLPRGSDGLAVGVTAIAAVALTSRCFGSLELEADIPRFLPDARNRLSFPLDYWNGLGVMTALGIPPLLRAAVSARTSLRRALALAPLPALASTIFLTSSRGATLAAIVGILVLLTLAERRGQLFAAVVAAVAGSAAALGTLLALPDLVDGPLDSPAAKEAGRTAAAILIVICAGTGVAYAATGRFLQTIPGPKPAVARTLVGLAVGCAAIAVLLSSPVERFERFKEPPGELASARDSAVAAHLFSAGGSGRWQFWTAAVKEFEAYPIVGGAAGSYEAWWAQHGTLTYFVRDAHSLYLEVLGELGLLGLTLLLGALATGVAAGVRGARRGDPNLRMTLAALTASFVAFAVAAGVDWMWELTIVGVFGMTCLGLIVGSAASRGERTVRRPLPGRGRLLVAAVAVGLASSQAVGLLGQVALRESQDAARRGDVREALQRARDAQALQPWAASPALQLALVEEQLGDLGSARTHVADAIARDGADWRLWLVAARLETKAGAIAAARQSLQRARALNPRSRLFAKERR